MRPASKSIEAFLTLTLVLGSAPPVLAQAGRYIPIPRIPFSRPPLPRLLPSGGGSHGIPHIPIHAGDDSTFWLIVIALGALALVFGGWHLGQAIGGRLSPSAKNPRSSWPLNPPTWQAADVLPTQDLILQRAEYAAKTEQTQRLMVFLAQTDPAFDADSLHEWILQTFVLVQKAWEARDYSTVEERLMPAILAKHEGLLKSMRENHEINRIEDLRIDQLEFIHLHCPQSIDTQVATVLITFWARVYFVDDRTGTYARGLRWPSRFQEFWSFRRQGEDWLLQEIEKSDESNRLKLPNFVAQVADQPLAREQSGIAL